MDNTVESTLLESSFSDEDGKKQLTKKVWDETKLIGMIALPSIVFRVTAYGVFIVTQSFIGHISSIDLAAYALVQSISMQLINGAVVGMSSATETLCGQAFGAKQYHMLGIYLQRSWIVNFVVMTIMLPIMIFSGPIFKLLGQEDEIADVAEIISLWFIPVLYTFVFAFTTQMFLQSQMKNNIVGYISTVVLIIHVSTSWIFVDKLNLGVPGAMGALIISEWSMVIGQFIYLFGGWCKETWKGFSTLAFADLLPVVKLSISSGFMLCLEIWYSSILVLIAGYTADAVVELSAFSICLSLNGMEFMIALSLMTGACVRVSNELGRGNIEKVKFAVKLLLWMAATLGILFFLICLIFGHSIPYLITSDAEVAEAAGNLSVLLALTMLVSSFQAIFSGVAIGCGSQAKVAIVNVVSYYIIGIPVGCLLTFVADLGIKGIWIGMLVGMVVQVIVLVILTWRIDWQIEVDKTKIRLGQFFHESSEHSRLRRSRSIPGWTN